MIRKATKEIIQVVSKNKVVTLIIQGGKILYQGIRSCFGAGYWKNDKPWLNDDGWR